MKVVLQQCVLLGIIFISSTTKELLIVIAADDSLAALTRRRKNQSGLFANSISSDDHDVGRGAPSDAYYYYTAGRRRSTTIQEEFTSTTVKHHHEETNDARRIVVPRYHDDEESSSASHHVLNRHSLDYPPQIVDARNLQTQTWTKLGSDIDGEAADDTSGRSVSLSDDGTVLAVGAYLNDGNGVDSGHVRVHKYASNIWTQLGSDINGEAAGDEFGFYVSLSSDGTVLAVGARKNDGSGRTDGGSVRVYKYASNAWTQLGSDIDAEAAGDSAGCSVSLSSDGSVLAIGAQLNDGSGLTDRGHVRIYKYITNVWTQLGSDIDGEAAGNQFGWSVSLSSDGSVVAVGAPYNASGGHIRVYAYSSANNVWTQLGSDVDGEATGEAFGFSVSLSSDGSVVAGGAIWNRGIAGDASGNARVFKYNSVTNAWTQLGGDIDGEVAHDNSGISVSLSGDGSVVAVGAAQNDGSATNAGHVRVYKYSSSSNVWSQLGSEINGEAAQDLSGFSTSLSSDGSVLAVGAYWNDGSANNAGHVRVFQLQGPPTFSPTSSKPTTAQPSFQPTSLPSRQPTSSPTAQPSFQPTPSPSPPPHQQPTSQPTAVVVSATPNTTTISGSGSTATPSKSPVYVTLPFLGGCPAQFSESDVIYYEPGDRVSNGEIVFECTSWPNSLFCSQAAFNPDLDSKTEHWKQAWDVVGHCTGTIIPPTAGCPDLWTPGEFSKYKENDQVSVVKNNAPLIEAVYKCKAWPYSWHCGQHSPLDYNGGKLGWQYIGECVGTIQPTNTPTMGPATVIIAGCPADYNSATPNKYSAGDQVAVVMQGASGPSSSYKFVYACRSFPFSGYCNQRGFAPGEKYDYFAWNLVGPCDGTLAPTSAPTVYAGGASCTYIKEDTTSPTPSPPALTPVSEWSASILYTPGDQVRIGAKKFQCKPWPYYFWCRVSVYAPTLSETGLWTEAWDPAGTCPP